MEGAAALHLSYKSVADHTVRGTYRQSWTHWQKQCCRLVLVPPLAHHTAAVAALGAALHL